MVARPIAQPQFVLFLQLDKAPHPMTEVAVVGVILSSLIPLLKARRASAALLARRRPRTS